MSLTEELLERVEDTDDAAEEFVEKGAKVCAKARMS